MNMTSQKEEENNNNNTYLNQRTYCKQTISSEEKKNRTLAQPKNQIQATNQETKTE